MPIPTALQTLNSFTRHVALKFREDGCTRSAAALTYMSLFAVVPLMTVMYAMVSAIPAFEAVGEQIQDFVFQHFVPATGQEVQTYLEQFSQQARRLTGVGIAILVVTALMMMKNIEKTFNGIWNTRENRSPLASFMLYWAILSLGPLCFGLAMGISTYLVSIRVLFDQVALFGIQRLALSVIPFILTTAAFTLLFAAVPNCRVPWRHALAGGALSGFAFEFAKQLFAMVVANTSYEVVYGAFSAIPLFLLWIYLSWVIVLIGAQVVHALSGFDTRRSRAVPDWLLCLAILEWLWRRHQSGEGLQERALLNHRWVSGQFNLSADRWATLRDQMLDAGLIKVAADGQFLLGRDLTRYTFWELLELLQVIPSLQQVPTGAQATWLDDARERLQRFQDEGKNILHQPLAALFNPPIPSPEIHEDSCDPSTEAKSTEASQVN